MWTERKIYIDKDRYLERDIYKCTDIKIEREGNKQIYRQTGRQSKSQMYTDRQTYTGGRQANRYEHIQRDSYNYRLTYRQGHRQVYIYIDNQADSQTDTKLRDWYNFSMIRDPEPFFKKHKFKRVIIYSQRYLLGI